MSYCRFKDGDVYIYADCYGYTLVCSNCKLDNIGDVVIEATKEKDAAKEMLTHLKKHQAANHKVPQKAIDRLNKEVEGDVK